MQPKQRKQAINQSLVFTHVCKVLHSDRYDIVCMKDDSYNIIAFPHSTY